MPGDASDSLDDLLERLRGERRRLLRAYVVHVAWFIAMLATAALDQSHALVASCIWLTLLTVPPVIWFAWRVHRTARRIDPRARTIGLGTMILMTVLLTPLESGLIAPVQNLVASAKVIRDANRRKPA
ncbi:MAG: hypothetical protein QM719_02565 [Thermomonas sp.]